MFAQNLTHPSPVRSVVCEDGSVTSTSAAATRKRLRPWELVVLAAPLLWVVAAILHPGAVGDEPAPYEGIADEANKWIFVHVSQLVLTPLLAAGVWMLLDGIQSAAATIARAFLVVWMVFFSAFDAIAGIAVGVLTRHANSLVGEEQEAVIGAIDFLFQDSRLVGGNNFSVLGILGQFSWVVLVIAAAVALWRAGFSRLVVGATLLSVLFASHGGYIAAVGLVALFVAELLRFTRSAPAMPRRAVEPAATRG
jgi:hypothetical protein